MGPSDFIIKRFPNQKLMPTRLIGGVQKPGFYQIPENTSLLSLMSYSGGALPTSNLRSVTIWRQESKQAIELDLEKVLHDPNSVDPIVQANDVIYIPDKERLISTDTVTLILVVSTIAATILSAIAINDRFSGRYP
jgi:protein involved in polysaccharide export with SLBB domain